jgi:hypothetical protein
VIRLQAAHRGERALVVFGGPSLIDQGVDFSRLKRKGFVVFLDTKALTPRYLESGVEPDYFLMLFPEKCKDNALQHYVFRSFLAGYNVRPFLKREHQATAAEMKARFDEYFEAWKPEKGAHKRYRWKPDVFLPDSPWDLLPRIPGAKRIVIGSLLRHYFPGSPPGDDTYVVEQLAEPVDFSLQRYFEPVERDGRVWLQTFKGMLNAAAIGLYPLLRYMGFTEVYCLGMDMSMLGTMEYAAPYTFKSMLHFRWFFARTNRVFNSDYRPNRPYYFRPQSEFEDLRALTTGSPLKIVRVYDPNRFAAPVPGVPTVSLREFLGR